MRLGHFGAFFDQSWRSHDIVWGRLNGSECLIRGLLPKDHPEVDELVERAHDSIIDDYAKEFGVTPGLGHPGMVRDLPGPRRWIVP